MPNWVEGNIRIRGKIEDIKRFLIERIAWVDSGNEKEYLPVIVDICADEFEMHSPDEARNRTIGTIKYDLDMAWVRDTRRNFIQGTDYYCCGDNGRAVMIMDFRAAWTIDATPYIQFSKDYDLDFRLYGFECGMQFGQDIIIENGELVKDETLTYNDWEWECPHPHWGG